jgi:hypothetical protein
MIRKTLGWCDGEGNPQVERHQVAYSDFEKAGLSRAMIRSAVNEAVRYRFIRCLQAPRPKGLGQPAITGVYELNWDDGLEYIKDPDQFRGFFAGDGNRTYVPNQFFDLLVPTESAAVLKVVGAVIRFSIGFQNKWGHRRRNVALSYQHIRNYTRIVDRSSVSAAIQTALTSNFLECVEKGYFDPDAGSLSKTAVYALKWLNSPTEWNIGMNTRPAAGRNEYRFENPTGIGSKTRPADRFENPTDIEIKQINKIFKQQSDFPETQERLRAEGFDERTAKAISSRYPAEQILRQISYIDRRAIKSNRLGMLRVAIERDWLPPGQGKKFGRPKLQSPRGTDFIEAIKQVRSRLADSESSI